MFKLERGILFQPDTGEIIPDGLLAWEENQIVYAGSAQGAPKEVSGFVEDWGVAQAVGRVILPGCVDTHTHSFQPEGIPGVLIENVAKEGQAPKFEGWLPETLKFETKVRQNPELAREIARWRFKQYIEHGITASLEYSTSSIEAVRIVLQEAKEAGLEGRIKVGYVAMDQEVDFIDGVHLELRGEAAQDAVLSEIRALASEFKGQVVIIDRFPIAVSSPYRKNLARLAQELGVLYETHVDESEGERNIHNGLYGGRSILQVLADDGVFADGMQVGLAHGIHTNAEDFALIEDAVRRGVRVNVRFCPDSNGNLGSHNWEGNYVPMPFQQWHEAGALVTLGTDKGAGTGWSVFAEALKERARLHAGRAPSELELLRMATTNGSRSLGLDDRLAVGQRPNFIVVNAASPFRSELPTDPNALAALVLRAGQNPLNVTRVVVNGAVLK